jgi:transposase
MTRGENGTLERPRIAGPCPCPTCYQHPDGPEALTHRMLRDSFSVMDEKQQRMFAAVHARVLGRGGMEQVHMITGLSRPTIRKGLKELQEGRFEPRRIRKKGGGRKKAEKKGPQPAADAPKDHGTADRRGSDLGAQVEPYGSSTHAVSEELKRQGHPACPRTVSRLLQDQGYSLRANVKAICRQRHPNRNRQFEHIGRKTQDFKRQGLPVLSADTKKKEVIGNFYNGGRTWRQETRKVLDHDFPSDGIGKAIPYGMYDLRQNKGMVVVGTSLETAAFGVDALTCWYLRQGRWDYPEADRLLILLDNGGCNGSRNRLWKVKLALRENLG